MKLGDECENNSQCYLSDPFGVCIDKKCDCNRKFMNINKRCRSIINLPALCNNDTECLAHSDNSTCVKSNCVCDIDFVSHSHNEVGLLLLLNK